MSRQSPRLIVGILFVALLTVTAGCTAALGDDPDPETIANELDERHDEIEDIQGTQVMTIERNGSTERTVTEVVERPPTESKREVIESDSEWQSEGDVMVSTNEKFILYSAEENTVTESELNRDSGGAAFANEGMISEALNESEISYEGTDTVADRDVHMITLTDEDTGQTTTIWADKEFWYPLKYKTTFESLEQGDEQWTTTMTYEDVTFNEGVDDEVFEFEPPENATVEEFGSLETQTIESADEVDAAIPQEFVEPDLPDEFAFEEATVTGTDDSVTTFVRYEADHDTVRFIIANDTKGESTGESVEIGNTDGTISEVGDQLSVAWECDGVGYSLNGDLDRETLVDSAASVGC